MECAGYVTKTRYM